MVEKMFSLIFLQIFIKHFLPLVFFTPGNDKEDNNNTTHKEVEINILLVNFDLWLGNNQITFKHSQFW